MRECLAVLLLLCSVLNLISAGPASSSPSQCSTYCSDSKLVRLAAGSSYRYSYSGWAETSLSPHSPRPEDHDVTSGLLLNATVTVTVLAPCEIALDMSEVVISGGGGADHAAELSRTSLRASLQAGRVETLCVEPPSSLLQRWALNVKRGVLSALQLSLRSMPEHAGALTVHETDVSGTCRTQYEYLQLDDGALVTRTKDLALCSGRNDAAPARPLDPATQTSRPLLRGDQECVQTLSEGRVAMVRCRETHVFQPFSSRDNGATTRIEQVLVLENVTAGKNQKAAPLPPSYRRTSLLYERGDWSEETPQDEAALAAAMERTTRVLEELSRQHKSLEVTRSTATKFGQLVRQMRTLNRDQLLTLTTGLGNSDVARELVLDALPMLDSAAAASAMTSLYVARAEQSPRLKAWLDKKAAAWFSSLANSKRADAAMLAAVQVLLREFEFGRLGHSDASSVVLGVSGLAHALCDRLGGAAQCSRDPGIREAVGVLERVVSPDQGHDQRAVLLAMKGLGNIGVFLGAETLLQNYYQNASANVEVRLAALDAFRRAPCPAPQPPSPGQPHASPLLAVYSDPGQDSEVRVAAYLAAVRCPSPSLLRAVKRTLYSETVNQVGSFVWTHLTNSQESSSKSRQALRALLANEFLQNKFKTDARQFSRNFEASRFFESIGVGATADANLIFSTKSYLPRSAMLNLTIDLFGESINLLEVGGRVEGLEPSVERLFSKSGALENEAVADFLRNSRADPGYDRIVNMTSALKQIIAPKASSYVRLFGNEISYSELADMLETSAKFDISPSILLKNLINRKEHEFSKSFELIDAMQEVPTALGLPLKLSVNGTASVKLVVRGSFETNDMGVQISGKFAPSANIAMSGYMTVGNDDFIQGIKFETTMFTHTNLDSRLKISYDGKLNFQSEMPNEKQTLIEMKSERFIFNGNKISKLPDLTPVRESYSECTGEYADKLFGIKICSEISYPNATSVDIAPYFPLTGDAHLNITIVKTDPTFKTYDFSTSWTYVPGVRYDFGIGYDRLGSSLENRRRVIQAVYDRDNGIARFTLDLPEKQAEMALSWDSKELNAAELVVTYDRVKVAEVFAKMGHQVKVLPGTVRDVNAGKYDPELKFKVKGLPEFEVRGVVNYVGNNKVSAELRLSGLCERVLTLGADYSRDASSGSVDARLAVDSPWVRWDVKGGAKLTTSSLGLKINGVYNVTEEEHSVDLLAKYNWNTQGALRRDYLNLRAQLSQWPRLSGQLTAEAMTSRGYYEGSARLLLAEQEWNVTQRAQSSGGGDVWLSQTLVCPQRGVDFRAEHRHKLKENSFSTTTTLHVDSSRQSTFHLDVKRIPGDGVSFSVESSVVWPGITFSSGSGPFLRSRLYQTVPGQYQAFLATQWAEHRAPLLLNVTYKDRSSLKSIRLSLDSQFTGAFGFTLENALMVRAAVHAESGRAHANTTVLCGEDEKLNIQATYELEMQEKHSFRLQTVLWRTKKYELKTAIVNTELEKSLNVDIIMSRHLAFNIKMVSGSVHSSVFWDKARDPSLNVTLGVVLQSPLESSDLGAVLVFPGQRIAVQGTWGPHAAVVTDRAENVRILRGYEVAGSLSWLPDRSIAVSGQLRGSLREGVQVRAELGTRGLPVLGRSQRRLEADFTPGSPPATVALTYAWSTEGREEHNVTCELTVKESGGKVVLDLKAASSLWDDKEAKAQLVHKYRHWTSMAGEASVSWGAEGVSLYWGHNLHSMAQLGVRSSWARLPSCGFELRMNEKEEEESQVTKHWLKVHHEQQQWQAVVTIVRNPVRADFSAQLDVTTPLPDYPEHVFNVTLQGHPFLGMNLTSRLTTPLVGDYAINFFSKYVNVENTPQRTIEMQTGIHVLNADTTVLKLNPSIQFTAKAYTGIRISLLIPEICNSKTSITFEKEENSLNFKFDFENNKKLLHDFVIKYNHAKFNDNKVACEASFSGFSYVIMGSKWEVEMKHSGTRQSHASFLRVNQFILDHYFNYIDDGNWSFKLTGKTNSDILNATLTLTDTAKFLFYLNTMGTEVINMHGDMDQGYANLNFMDSVLQIHSKFSYLDELKTHTKIISDSKTVATISTNTFLKHDEEGTLQSLVFSGNLLSGKDSAELKFDMYSGRIITGSFIVDYADHQLDMGIDLFSFNNSVKLIYSTSNQRQLGLESFVYLGQDTTKVGLAATFKGHSLWLKGELNINEEQIISAQATVDGTFDQEGIFPVSLSAKISLLEKRIALTILDANKSGVSIQGELKLEPQSKSITFKGSMPGYNDEFINLDIKYETVNGKLLIFSYEKKRFKYVGEFRMTDELIEAKLQTPLEGYEKISLRLGLVSEEPRRAVLEFSLQEYQFDAEMLFTGGGGDNAQVIVLARSTAGLQLEALFTKLRTSRATDCALTVQINGNKVEAGALLEFGNGNLNITTNVTRGGETARMVADIRRTDRTKSFAITSEFRGLAYRLHIYSSTGADDVLFEQGFKVQTPSFDSEFKYEKSTRLSLAYLKFQNQVLQCSLNGSVKQGELVISQTTEKSMSELKLVFDFDNQIDATLTALLNEQLRENIQLTIANSEPLYIKAIFNPHIAKALFNLKYKDVNYLADGSYISNKDGSKINAAIDTPFFEKTSLNVSFKFAEKDKIVALHFDYGEEFYDIFSEVSVDGSYAVQLNLDMKSSLPNFERIKLQGGFKNDDDFRGSFKINFPTEYYVITINSIPDQSFDAKLETMNKEYEIGYSKNEETHMISFKMDKNEIVNATFTKLEDSFHGSIITPYEKYRNITMYVGLGSNIPSKSIEIHRNNELVFKAHMYPVDNVELQAGTGIMATFYQGNEKLVYDAQFSVNNPVYIILKQHETVNGTRDILHFSLNVTDEYTASGEAVILLPIAPHTKILAKGHIQIENNNAEFKVSYKIDGEQESNFSLNYHSFTDDYNIYNIVTNITTPFNGYESMSLKMQSSLTETVVNFMSPFSGYENIRIVSVHRLQGNKKELQVQYQNMKKRIFYVKAFFHNEPKNKLIDLEARSPFLNGQALVYSNGSVMGVKLEQDRVILTEIVSRFQQLDWGHEYQFTFRKPDKVFELSTNFNREKKTEFKFITTLDNESLISIDFLMSPHGHVTATFILPDQQEYTLAGDIDYTEKSLQMSVTGQNFKTECSFAIKSEGFVKIESTLLEHHFSMSWNITLGTASFNLNTGPKFDMKYISSESYVDMAVTMQNSIYSFALGQIANKGWPNIKVALIWNSESIVDFQHQFLTDNQITLVRTKLSSPYLGTHKNMKFELTLKTKDILSIEAEFKWRPKDLTTFKSQLKLDVLSCLATVDFKSPFSSDFLFTAAYDFSDEVKSMEIFYHLLETVHLKAIVIPSGDEQKLNITLTTPVQGYKLVSLVGVHKISRKVHTATLKFTRDIDISEIQLSVDNGNLKVVISTPETRWLITGLYEVNEGTHGITGAFQWGGVKDVVKAEIIYKPDTKFLLNIDGPFVNYKIDYKSNWNSEKKSIDLLLKRNQITAEFNFQLAIKDNLYMLVAFMKSPFIDFIRVSSILDSESQELRGALQINETVYSIHASRINDNQFSIGLLSDDVENIHFDVSFDGEIKKGLKVEVICKTPQQSNIRFDGSITMSDIKKSIAFDVLWNENYSETISFIYQINEFSTTEIQTKINTLKLSDFEGYLNYGPNYVSVTVRNQSETFKGQFDYLLTDVYSLNATVEYNEQHYTVKTYVDPNDVTTNFEVTWPKNHRVNFEITLRPGDISLRVSTPFIHFGNVQISGKYSEYMSNNLYQITSSANAKWDEYTISLEGSVRNSQDNYGISGILKWGQENAIKLNCEVLHNKTLLFDITTPFKGLPHLSAKLEALKYRHVVSGIQGEIQTPFIKLPHLNFTFNRFDGIIEAKFSFDTATYRNISIHTKFTVQNNNYLFLHINTPFLNQVKQINIDAKSNKVQSRGLNTKIMVHIDDKLYEIRNNYTIINSKLDSSVYMRGPSSHVIEFKFGGKFILNSFSDVDIETYFNDDLVAVKYSLSQNAMMAGKLYLPSSRLWKIPSEFDLTITRDDHFEGKLNYNYGGLIGNALVKNKLTESALETVMYLNLPRILKYPLQLELNANYVHPRLQFTGYASFMAEHRLDLTMAQNSFRTTLDAHLNSAFFKGTKKFSLSLTSDTLSVSMNDEIRVTGLKKPNMLVLTLSQLHKELDHTLTYNWELLNIPKFEVTLESPILTAKKATFSATYLGLTQGVNLKLVSGTESLNLDYGLVDKKTSKGIKIIIGNANTQVLNFAANLNQIQDGHELIADLNVLEVNYKASFNCTLPISATNPMLTASLKLDTPYLFPMKVLAANLKAGRQNNNHYLLAASVLFDDENITIKSDLQNDTLTIEFNSSFDNMKSFNLIANYNDHIEDKIIIQTKILVNGNEIIVANASSLLRPHSLLFECHSKAKIQGFEEFHMKLTIPFELKYSLIANVELITAEPFKAYFILTSRPAYTNLDLVMTGLSANIHLTSNQGDFSYKSGSDDYHMRIYSKSSGHELHSELTVNSGSLELLKAGLFGMYHNHTDFYILMSTTAVYEPVQNVVFYVGAEKSQIRFGAEYEGSMEPSKQSYTATINHHVVSLTDFDLGLTIENSDHETFTAKLTHTLKSDFYVALAQINKSILKLTKINQDQVILATATAKHGEFSSEMSGKLILNPGSKGIDIKLTLENIIYQIGGLYNISEEHFKASFDIDTPFTSQNSLSVEVEQPNILYVAIHRNHSSLIMVDFNPLKNRTKYILFNMTDTKFMLNEFETVSTYDLSATLLYHTSTYQTQFELTRDINNPGTYKCNTTITFPSRTVGLYRERVKTEYRTASEIYLSWENLDKRIGYSYDVFKDNFKTNVKLNLEIPNRAMAFKTHKKYMIIDNDLVDLEYGIQFNWNTKIHITPITFVTSLKHNQNVGYLYIVLAHPTFNNTFVIDGEIKLPNANEIHFASQVGTVNDGTMSPMLSTSANITRHDLSTEYKLKLVHPDSSLHHVWDLTTDWTRGLLVSLALTDATNNRHASGTVEYVANVNRVELSLACQEMLMELAGQIDVDRNNGRYGATIWGSYDPLSPPVSLSAAFERLDAERMRVTAELQVADDRSYSAEARYSPSAMSALVVHHEYGSTLTAVQASLALNTSETLWVRGRYRPELWSNLTSDLTEPAQRAALVAQKMDLRLRGLVREEIMLRLSGVTASQQLGAVYRRVLEHSRSQWAGLRQDFAAVRNLAAQMYARDDFYVKTICEFSVGAFWQGKQMLGAGMARVQEAARALVTRVLPELATAVYRATVEPLVQGFQKLAPSFARFLRRIADSWRKVQTAVSASFRSSVTFLRDAAINIVYYTAVNMQGVVSWMADTKETLMDNVVKPWLKSMFELATTLENWFTEVTELVSSLPDAVERYFMGLEETQALLSIYQQYSSWLEELRFAELVTSLREAFRSWYAGLLMDLHAHLGEHGRYVTMALDAMKGSYDEVMTLPPVVYVRMVQARVNQKLTWLWEYYNMEQTLQEVIINLSDVIIHTLGDWADNAMEDYRQGSIFSDEDSEDALQYDSVTGDFTGTIHLPFQWRRFDQTPVLNEDVKEKFENLRYAVMDKMYHLATQSSDFRDTVYRTLLPPFSSNALITVNGHVITFDGNHYKIKDQLCGSYLLAADYYDHKFSVSVNYGTSSLELTSPGPLRSLTLHTMQGHRVDLALDNAAKSRGDEEGFSRVIIDGEKVELPASVDGFRLRREGQQVVAQSEEGVSLRCNVVAGLCSLELPGWFHGRVAGLAGSLDRELSNDVISPQGSSLESLGEFFKQWRVSQGTSCSIPSKSKVREGRVRSSPVCERLFQNSDSPLQPCFARLDPAPFRLMCDQDAVGHGPNRPDNEESRGPECLAAEAYVEQCKFVGMELSMPLQCVHCRLPSGRSLEAGEVVIYDSAPGSRLPAPPALADVVFVVERAWRGGEEECLEGRHLAELPAKLESVLRATLAINSTRFALLSFGAGQQPALHTLEGLVWNGRRSLQHTLTSLKLESTPEKATDRDLLEALLAAASKLSFRAGASKSVILAPCASCARSEETATVFAEASSMLLEADVRLHVLQRDEMPFRRAKKRQTVNQGNVNPVMGVDSHGAYTGRRVKGTSIPLPSKAIMKQLAIPKDLCTPLALETNGTLFSASRLVRGGEREQQQTGDTKRKWMDVWSRRVASSAKPSPCQTCDCLPYVDGSSRVTCTPCVSPSIQYFLQEWEDFLEATVLDELEESDDDTSMSAESLDALTARLQEETEAERLVITRLRDMLIQGKAIPDGV